MPAEMIHMYIRPNLIQQAKPSHFQVEADWTSRMISTRASSRDIRACGSEVFDRVLFWEDDIGRPRVQVARRQLETPEVSI